MSQPKAAPSSRGAEQDTEQDAYTQQLNVRFKPRRVNQVRRLAASRGESLQEYFDRLVLQDVKREQKRLMKALAAEEDRVLAERRALLADIGADSWSDAAGAEG